MPKKSGNLQQNSKIQGKVKEFCCLKFIFSQVEDPSFENFLGKLPQTPLNGLGPTVELNLGLEKSGNVILSGKWQPCEIYANLIGKFLPDLHMAYGQKVIFGTKMIIWGKFDQILRHALSLPV